ncbi:hypothetical protein EDD80_12111 [Anseongella ginsenosidimutans]|uniref:Uncharacterized protein n=1 Tax=Anseongella ginsenosidimutans TaxID=496056 RepID=A0A4R3KKK8_9SPHI|nr:hypothetical protein [Anseongella ginsenosidimutans]QEC51488.1 hypothetical protein FRZ59_03385 [Anseongella ginsenosidimutans]TCS84334.1 hypothetical protein EDD80_12111 [Anseongella ginsenosidimutans]
MKEILLNLFQIFNSSAGQALNKTAEALAGPEWLNEKKHQLFLNPEEIFFSEEWIKLMDGDSETYIDWEEIAFFYYPFVGVNIKLPGFKESRYFTLIVQEDKENDPILNDFIDRLREQKEICRL